MPQLLLELFSEEIPARRQEQAARDLARMATERLTAAGLTPESLVTYSGARRLTLVAEGLPAAQSDRSEERKGPRVGAPDAAIEGFLRSTGLTRADLAERDGVYFATIASKGRPTAAIIAEMVPEVIRAFPWPKSMTWGLGALRWVRPLKRILCVFGGEVVDFHVDGIVAGRTSEGHRFMGSAQPFQVKDFADYKAALEKHYVVLDAADRKARIMADAHKAVAARGLELVDDDGLLDEVAGLSEWPVPILGDMDPAFLELPPEVIRTSMRNHQKYFAVRDTKTGKLAANFLTVANIDATDGGKAIAAGNARVLSARLSDAKFFWDEDRKVGFGPWSEKLKGVTFHAKLGTMAERAARLVSLAETVAPIVGADVRKAGEAARLAKADLASQMVGEFPELQGLMGGYYAREAGLSDVVADAVRDHYKPQGPSDEVPVAPVSVAVALADKIDTLVGFFAIGEKPTGSRDPYALRRAALGLIRILQKTEVRLPARAIVAAWYRSLKTLIGPGRALYASSQLTTGWQGPLVTAGEEFAAYVAEFDQALLEGQAWLIETAQDGDIDFDRAAHEVTAPKQKQLLAFRPFTEVAAEVTAFLADRLKVALRDQGRRHDLVDAVFALGDDDLVRIVARVEALDGFLATEDGVNLLAAHRRAVNILKAEEKGAVLPAEPSVRMDGAPDEEKALFDALQGAMPAVQAALKSEDYGAAMKSLSGLRGPVFDFLDKVLVNAPEAAVRQNRLALLMQIRGAMEQVADFSQVSG